MTCPACGQTNPEGARFCNHCGSPLASPVFLPAAPVLPTSFVGGRYQVKRFLGEGGKKKVYLAHDTVLDRNVAFSLIKTEGLDEVGIERVRREARVMGRLGGHPHLVAIHDLGEEDGQPFLVAELMAGGDVEALIQRSSDHRPALTDSLRIAEQVCQALAHAHAHGVIHRDLKPGNVWLTRDGAAKLGDFGLAMAIDKTRLSMTGLIVGTARYMSPEQALGRTPDARSDLYAFGAVLYELVTGRPPFLGDDPVAVISQHINAAPVAPSWHNPDLPGSLEALILRLLAKDPDHRPTGADATRRDLLAIIAELAGAPAGANGRASHPAANPLDRLAGGVFVGREHELTQLRGACDAALAGCAGVILLTGEPGIGKTSLAEETVTYARLRGAQVLWGRCYEWEGAPAYWPWVQIIRGYLHTRDPQQLRTDLGTAAVDIAQVVSEVRDQLPDLPPLPRLEAEQARFRLFDGIANFLRNATTRAPLVLVLDDLHWADTPSLLLLQFAARELDRSRILVIGTYRDVEVGRRHPLTFTLAELVRGRRMLRIPLRGLSAADTARFIALSTGVEPESALVDAVQRETEGNPFFVGEVVRLLATEGRLNRASGQASWSSGIPQSARDVVGQRLDRLSAACNEVLAIASVQGTEFTLPVLERVADLEPDSLLDALGEAVRARLIQEDEPAGRYRFNHALVRDTLYSELSAARQTRLHGSVGRALEQLHAANPAPHYGELARHFASAAPAGHATKAVEYAIRAGKRAMSQAAWETAIRHYEQALHAMDLQVETDAVQRCDVLLTLAAAQYRAVPDVGAAPEGRHSYLDAAEIARALASPDRLARAALGFASAAATSLADATLQAQLLTDGIALAPQGDDPFKARLMSRLAVHQMVLQDTVGTVEDLSAGALTMARRLGDPGILASVLLGRRVARWRSDNLTERLDLAAEARHMAETAGDPYDRLWSHWWGGLDLYEAADNDGTRACLYRFQRSSQRLSGAVLRHAALPLAGAPRREGR